MGWDALFTTLLSWVWASRWLLLRAVGQPLPVRDCTCEVLSHWTTWARVRVADISRLSAAFFLSVFHSFFTHNYFCLRLLVSLDLPSEHLRLGWYLSSTRYGSRWYWHHFDARTSARLTAGFTGRVLWVSFICSFTILGLFLVSSTTTSLMTALTFVVTVTLVIPSCWGLLLLRSSTLTTT